MQGHSLNRMAKLRTHNARNGIENAPPSYMALLLASPPPPPTGEILAPQPLAMVGYSSESSNSVNGPDPFEDEE